MNALPAAHLAMNLRGWWHHTWGPPHHNEGINEGAIIDSGRVQCVAAPPGRPAFLSCRRTICLLEQRSRNWSCKRCLLSPLSPSLSLALSEQRGYWLASSLSRSLQELMSPDTHRELPSKARARCPRTVLCRMQLARDEGAR